MVSRLPMVKLDNNTLAFAVVVLASYAVMLSNPAVYSPTRTLVALILLGVAYLGLGVFGSREAERRNSAWFTAGFLAAELALGGFLNLLGRGGLWLMLLPVAAQAVQNFRAPWAVLICGVLWTAMGLPYYLQYGLQAIISWGPPFLAAIVFVAVFAQLAHSEQKARAELAEANRKLREYAAQAEELAVVRERNRLAREIHDGLGHYLTAIHIQVKAAQAVVDRDPAQTRTALANAHDLTTEALADVRRSVSALRADPTTNRPLAEVLEGLIKEAAASGLHTHLDIEGAARPLAAEVEFTLYRVAQEGLTNVRKHARASTIWVRLVYAPRTVTLTLRDDGQGSPDPSGGFGLVGVRERVELFGGRLEIQTAPGQGFSLSAELPLPD